MKLRIVQPYLSNYRGDKIGGWKTPIDGRLRCFPNAYNRRVYVRTDRLKDRSGTGAGVGEYDRPLAPRSNSCSCRTTEYLGSRTNLGTES